MKETWSVHHLCWPPPFYPHVNLKAIQDKLKTVLVVCSNLKEGMTLVINVGNN